MDHAMGDYAWLVVTQGNPFTPMDSGSMGGGSPTVHTRSKFC